MRWDKISLKPPLSFLTWIYVINFRFYVPTFIPTNPNLPQSFLFLAIITVPFIRNLKKPLQCFVWQNLPTYSLIKYVCEILNGTTDVKVPWQRVGVFTSAITACRTSRRETVVMDITRAIFMKTQSYNTLNIFRLWKSI